MNCFGRFCLLFAALALPLSQANAVNWTEAAVLPPDYLYSGELSGDGATPTPIFFSEGHNLVEGTMGFDGVNPMDADVWTFTIAAGYYLTGINLLSYSDNGAGKPVGSINSFMAIDDATSINMSDPSNHLSNGLWNEQLDGFGATYTDLMAILDAGPQFGGDGFNGPLGPGDYTFWVQEGTDQISYCIDFVLTPVPEPGSFMLLGLAGLLALRRRR